MGEGARSHPAGRANNAPRRIARPPAARKSGVPIRSCRLRPGRNPLRSEERLSGRSARVSWRGNAIAVGPRSRPPAAAPPPPSGSAAVAARRTAASAPASGGRGRSGRRRPPYGPAGRRRNPCTANPAGHVFGINPRRGRDHQEAERKPRGPSGGEERDELRRPPARWQRHHRAATHVGDERVGRATLVVAEEQPAVAADHDRGAAAGQSAGSRPTPPPPSPAAVAMPGSRGGRAGSAPPATASGRAACGDQEFAVAPRGR